MSRYDGLIIPRSYSEYINKTDAATLQQALQLSGVLSEAVAAGDNKAVTSNAVNGAFASYPEIISNDNGIAYKFPSGVLICTKHISFDPTWSSWGAIYESNEINIGEWPYYFIQNETPRIQANVVGLYGGFVSTVKDTTYINAGVTTVLRPVTADATMYVDIIGIGRWK